MEYKKGLIYSTIKKKRLTIFVVIFVFITGIMCYMNVPKQEYPVVQVPVAVITTIYPGASASDIEELISSKIEDIAMEAVGFDSCTSESYSGASVVSVSFGLDLAQDKLDKSISDLRNKVDDLKNNELPDGITNLTFETNLLDTAGLILAFTGDNQSNAELVQRAEELKNNLKGMNGVYKVEVKGEVQEEIKITVNTEKLNRMNLSLNNIVDLVSAQNSIIPVGTIDFEFNKLTVNSSGKFADIEEIGNIIIQIFPDSGSIIKLKDISTIQKDENVNDKRFFYNGKKAILLNLYFDDEANILNVGTDIMSEVNRYISSMPFDVYVDKVIYLPDDVGKSINNFTTSLIQSVLIVLVIVMVGMSIRNGIIVSIAIPLSIFLTFIAMSFLNIDIQFISLAALITALGMLVDNAIVVSDAIQVRFDNDEEKMSACIDGAKEVAMPVLASTLTTVAIFTVFFSMPGTMGKFTFSLPAIVISALLASYIVSMLVTPVMCYMFIKKSPFNKKQKRLYSREFFSRLFDVSIKHKFLTFLISFVVVVGGVILLFTLELQLLPNSEKNIVDIDVVTSDMNDIRKTNKAIEDIETIVSQQPEVEFYLSSVGGRVPKYDFSAAFSTSSINKGSLMLRVDINKDKRFKDKAVFVEYLQKELNTKVSGCKIVVKELGVIPEMSEAVQVRISGNDFEQLNNVAKVIEQELEKIDGTKNIYSDRKIKTYDYYVDMKNNLLNSYGLTKSEVQNELNIALMGRNASIYRENLKEYPIIVKSDIDTSTALENLMLKSSASGNKYQLKQLSDVTLKEDFSSISRYNGKRTITISAGAEVGFSPISIQTKLKESIEKNQFGNIDIIYQGDSDLFFEVLQTLVVGAVVAIMIIFLILFIQFNSIKQSLIILISIPFSFIGASLGLLVFRQKLSMFAILGLISLIGVVVNNAIVLVDFINTEKLRGIDIDEACKEAVSRRFRPIMLSTITTVLGLIPLAISGNVLFKGMAIAFMFGLSTSLVFTLVVIPVVYSALHRLER